MARKRFHGRIGISSIAGGGMDNMGLVYYGQKRRDYDRSTYTLIPLFRSSNFFIDQ